jgi:hypothetical protein
MPHLLDARAFMRVVQPARDGNHKCHAGKGVEDGRFYRESHATSSHVLSWYDAVRGRRHWLLDLKFGDLKLVLSE